MPKFLIISVFINFLIVISSNCQIIPFKNYTVKDGLPSSFVSDIKQDNKGFMWLATNIGIVRFDGYNMENITIRDGLSDNYIHSLVVDDHDNVWAGTEKGGISIIGNQTIYSITEKDGLFSNPVKKLFKDSKGNIWAYARENGVSIIKKDTIISFTEENSIIKNEIFCYEIDSKGTVWLGNYDGIYYYDSVMHHIDHQKLTNLIVWDIACDNSGHIWIASQDNGVFCYFNDTVISYNVKNGLTTNTTLSLIEDNFGRIIVGTYDGGINIIDNGKVLTEFSEQTSKYVIWQLYRDSKDRIWCRTFENGVLLLKDNDISNYSEINNLVSDYVLSIYEDIYGNVWFATEDGISKYGKSFFEVYNTGFAGDDENILSVFVDNKGLVYAGSYSGLTILGDGSGTNVYSTEDGLPEEPIIGSIAQTEDSEIWLGTNGLIQFAEKKMNHFINSDWISDYLDVFSRDLIINKGLFFSATEIGLFVFDKDKFKHYTKEDGLIGDNLYSVNIDQEGKIWCGATNGLSIFDGNSFHNFTEKNGLPNNYCNDIAFDDKGVAWIGTDYGVCSAVLSERGNILSTRNYSMLDGLKSNSIFSVIIDDNQNVWLGHNKGIDCFNPRTKRVKNYGLLEGFLSVETNSCAVTKDYKGNIWFGTVDGLVKYIPHEDTDNTQPPKVYITGIELFNDSARLENYYTAKDSISFLPLDLKLHHSKRNLVFKYVGLHYTIVEKNIYKYRLLGYEEKWSEPTTEVQTPPYRKLDAGKYKFQVLAANCDGIWTYEPSEFEFQILPPWWLTWWAIGLDLVVAIALLFLAFYLRERKLRHDKRVLIQKVKERTLEIEKQKDQIEVHRDEITRQKKEITDSIQYAQHIQSAILPKDDTVLPLLKEYFILYKPRDIVSGDFYWINSFNKKVIAIAADCTGHGVPGAFMSMLGVSILNQIAASHNTITAGEILDKLRQQIISTLSHTKKEEEARDGMDMALCIIDYSNYSVQFAGAYNPLVVLRDSEMIVHKADKMPVGSFPGKYKPFTSLDIEIKKNDCLYMYSDGYADQFGGEAGKKFKSGPFKQLLADISHKSMVEQLTILDNTIVKWQGEEQQVDDILVLGFRIL